MQWVSTALVKKYVFYFYHERKAVVHASTIPIAERVNSSTYTERQVVQKRILLRSNFDFTNENLGD